MTFATINDAYAHYSELCGGTPVLSRDELRDFIHDANLRYEEIDENFWESLPAWVWGTEPRPE